MPARDTDAGHIEVSSASIGIYEGKAELVQRLPQLLRVSVDAKGAGAGQLVLAVAAAEQADAEHPRPACGEQIPDGIADDVALLRRRRRACAAQARKRSGSGFARSTSPRSTTTVSGPRCERLERGVDLGPSARGRDPERHPGRSQLGEELDRLGERPALRKQLAEELAVTGLNRLDFVRRSSGLATSRATARVKRPPLIPIRR